MTALSPRNSPQQHKNLKTGPLRVKKRRGWGERDYRDEAVELGGLDHLAEPELLLVDGALAGLARRSRRLRVLHPPGLGGYGRHCSGTLAKNPIGKVA